MKPKFKQIIWLFVAFATSVACSESEVEETLTSGNSAVTENQISFTAQMNTPATKATDTAFESGDEISVTAYASDGSIYRSNVNYSYGSNSFTSTSPIEYSTSTTELEFRALYPYVEMSVDKTASFTVYADQNSGTNYTLSDLMFGYSVLTSEESPQLIFDHLLTKIVVNITSSDIDMAGASATLTAIAGVECDLTTFATSSVGSAQTITMASNGTNSYKVIIAPQTIDSSSPFGLITAAGNDYEFYITSTIDLQGGSQYTINATIKDGAITFNSPMISEWEDGEFGENNEDDIPEGAIGIYNYEDLAKIGSDTNYPLDGDYVLMNDISLESIGNWVPIGSITSVYNDNPFAGTFDGRNYTISNLTIDSNSSNQGLFGYAKNATISNVNVDNIKISGGSSVAAIVGSAWNVEVTNCSATNGTVSGTMNIGGIIGNMYSDYWAETQIADCHNSTSVSSSYTIGNRTGGIVGYISSDSSSITYIVSNCSNIGKLSGTVASGTATNAIYIGGIIGYSSAPTSISACYNTGEINANSDSGSIEAGGIAGYLGSSNILSCYNTGTVSGKTTANVSYVHSYVGGIVGEISYSTTVKSGYNAGTVSSSVKHSSSSNSAGGVIGHLSSGSISKCYFIDQDGDDTSTGVGSNSSTSYDYMALASIYALNSVVSTMNSTAGNTYFIAGSPTDTVLPYLYWEE